MMIKLGGRADEYIHKRTVKIIEAAIKRIQMLDHYGKRQEKYTLKKNKDGVQTLQNR